MYYNGLDKLSLEELKSLFSKDNSKWVRCIIPANKKERVTRIVPLKNPYEDIKMISQLSYCPKILLSPDRFNRCNLPKQEMFYGTLWGEEGDEIINPIITSVFETSRICQKESTLDEFYLSGEWIVCKEMRALVIFDYASIAKNKFFANASIVPEQFLKDNKNAEFGNPEIVDAFSKPIKQNDDYLVSAAYADHIFSTGRIDAIIYPSVKTDATGTCIAIQPSFVDNGGLHLVKANKYKMFLAGKDSVRGFPYQRATINGETGETVFYDI